MTQHDDPLIQDQPLSWYERWMDEFAATSPNGPPLRGIRVEPNDRGQKTIWFTDLSTNPDLGIHHSGPRMGARITLVDLGWSREAVRGMR